MRGPFYEFGAFKRPEKFVDCEEGREAGAVHFPPPPGPAKRGSRLRPQQTRPGEPCRGPALGPPGVERPRTFAEPPHPRLHAHSATWLGMRPDFPKLQRSLGGRFRFVSKVCFLAA